MRDVHRESGESAPDVTAGDEPQRARDLSVIVPCHNEADTLPAQLRALTAESWSGDWEILVVDNASTDDTAAIARSFDGAVPVRVITAIDGRGVAYARNAGIAASNARSIAICDGDDLIAPGWVAAMGDALATHTLVSSRLETNLLNPAWLADTRPLPTDGLPRFGEIRFAHGGACGMHRSVWTELGGYDSAYDGVEDIEFGLRAHAAGHRPVRAGDAVVHYRLRQGLRHVWRQGVGYGRRRADLRVRAESLGLAPPRRSAGWKSVAWLLVRFPTVVTRRGRYAWTWTFASRVGVSQGSLRPPSPTRPEAVAA